MTWNGRNERGIQEFAVFEPWKEASSSSNAWISQQFVNFDDLQANLLDVQNEYTEFCAMTLFLL